VRVTEAGSVLDRKKFSGWIKKVNPNKDNANIESERLQGKLERDGEITMWST